MPSQPQNADHYVIQMLETEDIVQTRGDKIKARNVLDVKVKGSGKIFVRGKEVPWSRLTKMTKAFIANPENKPDLATSPKEAIISLQNERGTNFDRYLKVYNALKAAYEQLWDEKAQELFNEPYSDDMPFAKRKAIREEIPFIISEAEPTNY